MSQIRSSDLRIDPVFLQRWSPRSFTGEAIDETTLFTLFEAARWAPSANNSQPWRFIYARNGTPSWPALFELLNEGNRRWAGKASALAILVSRTSHRRKDAAEHSPLRSHALDAGAAWASLALQAVKSGWHAHAIGGFDREAARRELAIPEGYHVNVAIAIGRLGARFDLPDDLQAREQPSQRQPLSELIAEGRFNFE